MTTRPAVALAARAHARNGRQRDDSDVRERMEKAARSFVSAHREVCSGPPSSTPDSVLVIPLARASGLVDALLFLDSALAPLRLTFAGALARDGRAAAPRDAGCLDAAVLAEGSAVELALSRLADTDPRTSRVVLLLPEPDPVLSALVCLVLDLRRGMTARQRQVIALVEETGSQQAVAGHLNVSRQAVNQSLAAAGWPALRAAELVARASLAAAAREDPGDGPRDI